MISPDVSPDISPDISSDISSDLNLPVPVGLTEQLSGLSGQQKAFLAGFLWASSQHPQAAFDSDTHPSAESLSDSATTAPAACEGAVSSQITAAAVSTVTTRQITVISVSQTGNAVAVANKLSDKLRAASLDVQLVSAGSYKARQLAKEDIVLVVTSTQGEGEPPEEGVLLYNFLFGRKAPRLDKLSFAVIGLGDSSYPMFCQAGIDFDRQLEALGAERLLDRVDADVDFAAEADAWIDSAVTKLKDIAGGSGPVSVTAVAANGTAVSGTCRFSKESPYEATLLSSHKLVTDDCEKVVMHIEIDLDDSGLEYQAGDSLGVITSNPSGAVDELLHLGGLSGDELIDGRDGQTTIRRALSKQSDLNQLTPKFIADYAQIAKHSELNALIKDPKKLQEYQARSPVVRLFQEYPQKLDAQRLFNGLKPLTPRLYSIASSQQEVGEEVHLCVGLTDIRYADKHYIGSASGLLSQRLEVGDQLEIFVESNSQFRLPADDDLPVIMIGPGTGIAPFRAFMQQRRAEAARGRNWLIFGNRHYRSDFLYHAEWVELREQGLLHDCSLAWSRDGSQKVYVQDKIREHAGQFWQWLEEGAHIYICGDARRMAKDAENAIVDVIATQGGKDAESAFEYLNDLREAERYQRDVY